MDEPTPLRINTMIKKKGKQWVLYSHDGSKVLGTFDSRKEAIEREKQVVYFKNKKKKSQ